MMSVYLAIKNPVELPDLGDWPLWRFTEDGLHSSYYERPDGSLGVAFREEDADYVAEALSHLTTEAEGYAWLRDYFESRGYDGIKYQNVGETPGEQAGDYSYIAFHPEQICIYDIRPCRVREPCPPCAEDHSFCP